MDGGEGQLFRFRFGNDELGCIGDFSEARLELRVSGELRGGVQPLPLKVLAHLLRHANDFVSLDTLLREVWPAQGIERRAVYNAIDKLREALGRDGAAALIENARGGYRFRGTVYARIPEAGALPGGIAHRPGDTVPWRPEFRFVRRLESGPGNEVWLARQAEVPQTRIIKFCLDADHLLDVRKEVALALVLRDRLGARDDMAQVIHWEFEQPPFFVESADGGQNLVAWAEEASRLKNMPPPERLAIALSVTEAVSAAHGVGVVHMDIKPSNILVAPGPGGWQVRVVDFGSGRSLDRAAIEKLEVQRLGLSVTQVVEGRAGSGTADYMAPEVRHGSEFVLPVLCDVYALGVVLYQLLAGDLRKPLAPGWERDIDDAFLREDIALATDGSPGSRLQSASALVQRLRELGARHAEHEQRLAQGALDQAQRAQAQIDAERRRRFEARWPWILSTVALLVLGLGLAVVQWRNAEAAKARAEASAAQAEAVTRFLDEDVLGLADPYGASPSPAIREALQRALSSLDHAFTEQPRTEAAVRMTIAGLLDKYGDQTGAEAQWRAAVRLLTRLDGEAARGTLQARYRTGAVIARAGKFDEAEAWLGQADRDAARGAVNDAPTAVQASHAWGLFHLTRQRLDLAAPPFEKALAIAQATPGAADDALLDSIRHGLITAYSGLGKFEASAGVARDMLASFDKRPAVGELRVAAARYDLGQALLYQGDLAAAAPLVASAATVTAERLGAGSPSAVMMQITRCELLVRRKAKEEALACTLDLHRAIQSSPATPQWMAWLMLGNAGVLQGELARRAEALQSLGHARDGLIKENGPGSALQFVNVNLALVRWRLGQASAALPLMEGLDPTALQSIEPDVPWPQRIALLRGLILSGVGREGEAKALLASAVEQLERMAMKEPEPLLAEAKAILPRLH